MRRETHLDKNVKTVYSLVWGQCTDIMRAKIESLDNYVDMSGNSIGLDLLQGIKSIVYNFQSQKFLPHALHDAKRKFYGCYQGKMVTPQAYLEQFQNTVDVIEHCGGTVGTDPGIAQELVKERNLDVSLLTNEEMEEIRKESQAQYLAVAFVLDADKIRYGKLIEDLENAYLQGVYRYPKTITAAYSLLTNWKQDPCNAMRMIGPASDGVSFAHLGEDDKSETNLANSGGGQRQWSGPRDMTTLKCYNCNKMGYYASDCGEEQKRDKSGTKEKEKPEGSTE